MNYLLFTSILKRFILKVGGEPKRNRGSQGREFLNYNKGKLTVRGRGFDGGKTEWLAGDAHTLHSKGGIFQQELGVYHGERGGGNKGRY